MSSDQPQPPQQPTEAEMAAIQEQLRQVRIEEMVVESALSILNIAIMRAGLMPGTEGDKDLQQVQVGIEAVRALLPQIEALAGPAQTRPIRDALSQLQMVYAQGTGAGAAPPPDQPAQEAAPQPRSEGPGGGRLWVPGQ
jgi:hypothetical protein